MFSLLSHHIPAYIVLVTINIAIMVVHISCRPSSKPAKRIQLKLPAAITPKKVQEKILKNIKLKVIVTLRSRHMRIIRRRMDICEYENEMDVDECAGSPSTSSLRLTIDTPAVVHLVPLMDSLSVSDPWEWITSSMAVSVPVGPPPEPVWTAQQATVTSPVLPREYPDCTSDAFSMLVLLTRRRQVPRATCRWRMILLSNRQSL